MAIPLRVLIVENSENDALLIADSLTQAGYLPDWVRLETADELRKALAEPWDLILADYAIPGFGGMEALSIYKDFDLDFPFLMVSGSIGEERAVEAMRAGVHDYIMKDRMQRLPPAVERELREASNRRERSAAIHENLRLNDELREKIALLSRSHADLEQVTWAASHDLKEPLRMVSTYTQLLLRRRPLIGPDEVEFAQYISQGVERVTALIDGLLAYAGNLQAPVDPSTETNAEAVALDVVERLTPMIQQRGAVVKVERLPCVRIEEAALFDIFQELFLNALEYRRPDQSPQICVSASEGQSEVCFAVRDNGIGIKPEHHDRIFQLFRRLHGDEYRGIGVGLPLCRRLIENYGGRMWLESEPGVGSTFFFTLEAAKVPVRAAAN
jgi:light-regulated signal transduction histidine kinase (bacteriophytochrome)